MKRIKEIDAEIKRLKTERPADWIKQVAVLMKERRSIASQIGVKKK